MEKRRDGLEPLSRSPGPNSVAESQAIEKNEMVRRLRAWDPQAVAEVREFRGEVTVIVPREHLRRAAEFICGERDLGFTHLSDLSSIDLYPVEPRFEVNYHFVSMSRKEKLRLKVRVPGSDPVVESVTPVWPGANWPEREVFDLFGIRFEGHADLRRIVLPVDWEGHPLRKDYPVEGPR